MSQQFKLRADFQEELDKLICPVHHKRGAVIFAPDKLRFECCCDEFKEQFIDRFTQLFADTLR